MENNSALKKRLYQNLLVKQNQSTSILGCESKSMLTPLKPKITKQNANIIKKASQMCFNHGKILLSSGQKTTINSKIKPISVQKQKLSKEGKALIEQGKLRGKPNLKPHDIFAFYQQFPEMKEDFFYLNQVNHPYDYQVISYSQRHNGNNMTISSQGITLYHDKQIEFITQQQWINDQKMYHKLQKINFFNQYKLSKNFLIWKNKMKRHYMKEMSNILERGLFCTHPHPRKCLLKVKYLTNILEDSIYFMPPGPIEAQSSQLFLKQIKKFQKTTFITNIKNIQTQIIETLEIAINQEILRFKKQNNIKIEGLDSNEKQGRIYSQQAILRKQYKRVAKLIKLADNNLFEAKIAMMKSCLEKFYQKIKQIHDQDTNQQWIICRAYPQNNNIIWQPSLQQFIQTFQSLITFSIKQLTENHKRIIDNQIFLKYKVTQQNEIKKDQKDESLQLSIQKSQYYDNLLKNIIVCLKQQFKKTKKQQQQLMKFIQIYQKHTNIQINNIFQKSVAQLSQSVRQWRQDNNDILLLPDNKNGGLLQFDYSLLRKKIINIPNQTLSTFLGLLSQQVSKKCTQLQQRTKRLLDTMNSYPTDIVSFVQFTKSVKIASQYLDQIVNQGRQLIQFVSLMQQNRLQSVDIYRSRVKQVTNGINILKNKVQQSNAKFNHSLSKFKKDLQDNINKNKNYVKDFNNKFQNIQYNKLSSDQGQTYKKIQKILKKIENLSTKCKNIQDIQNQLALPQSNFNDVYTLYQKVLKVNQLWLCRKKWREFLSSLYSKHFNQIKSAQLQKYWDQFNIQSLQFLKQMPQNQISKKLNQQINQFQDLINVINALQVSNLDSKAWGQLSQYLSYQLNLQDDPPFYNKNDPKYTIEWLIRNNLMLFKDNIELIVKNNEQQKQVILVLSRLKIFLVNLPIETVIKKDRQFQQQIIIFFLIKFVKILLNQKRYQNVVILIILVTMLNLNIISCQNFWKKLPNSHSIKLLTKQAKDFSSWQTQWKKIIKIIISQNFHKKLSDQTANNCPNVSTMKQINKINMVFQQIKKGIQDYLDKRRNSYYRYFFFTDQQLIEILSHINQGQSIPKSVISLIYDNIDEIIYDKDLIIGFISKSGQKINLKHASFKAQSQIQKTLKIIDDQIKKTFNSFIKNSFISYTEEEINRQNLFLNNTTQVALAVDQIAWVRLAEETYLCSQPLGDLYDWIEVQQDQIIQLQTILKQQNTSLTLCKLEQVLSQSIYFRQKTQTLLEKNIVTTNCFQWEIIPKLILNQTTSEIYLKQLSHKIFYCGQYLGNNVFTFITPETEKIWVNVLEAVEKRDPVYIRGYYSTGVETIKQLAYMVGQKCINYQIENNTTCKTIERFIAGICLAGHWMIINLSENQQIVSVIANQLAIIKNILINQNTAPLQINRINISINQNTSFFLRNNYQNQQNKIYPNCIGLQFHERNLFRIINYQKPNFGKIMSALTECKGYGNDLGLKIYQITNHIKQLFNQNIKLSNGIILKKIMQIYNRYTKRIKIKNKLILQRQLIQSFKEQLQPLLLSEYIDLFRTYLICLINNFKQKKQSEPVNQKNRAKSVNEKQQVDSRLINIQKQLDSMKGEGLNRQYFKKTSQILFEVLNSNYKGIVDGVKIIGNTETINLIIHLYQNLITNLNDKINIEGQLNHSQINNSQINKNEKHSLKNIKNINLQTSKYKTIQTIEKQSQLVQVNRLYRSQKNYMKQNLLI